MDIANTCYRPRKVELPRDPRMPDVRRWSTDATEAHPMRTPHRDRKPRTALAQANRAERDAKNARLRYEAGDMPVRRGTWALLAVEPNMSGGRKRGNHVRARCTGDVCGGTELHFGMGEWLAMTADVTCKRCSRAKTRAEHARAVQVAQPRTGEKAAVSYHGHRGRHT